MISRRLFVGSATASICAPAIVRATSLMPARHVATRIERRYYGFVERLWIGQCYRSGSLQGQALLEAVRHGLLSHVDPDRLALNLKQNARSGVRATAAH